MPVFKSSKGFYEYEVNDILVENLKSWIRYGLLELGAYTAAKFNLPTSGLTILKRTYDDRSGGSGKVFEGMGPSWVWETDVSAVQGNQPIFQVSGVYVNNTFYPTASTTGTYSHYVDYRNGRVVFNNALPSTDVVKCEYVFNNIDVFSTNSRQWKTITHEYEKQFNSLDGLSPSGMAAILKQNRVWLPSVVVDLQHITSEPLQLGGGEIAKAEVAYHIFADTAFSAYKLCNILGNEESKVLTLYDINKSPFPYNYNGSLASGAITYPNLSDRGSQYFWTYAQIEQATAIPYNSVTNVFRSETNHTISIDRYLSTY
jgi:hypothetical protein